VLSSSYRNLTAAAALVLALAIVPERRARAEPMPDELTIELLDEELTGSFDERFLGGREMPIFTRPEIADLFSNLPALPEEGASIAAAPEPAQPSGEQDVAVAEHKTPAQFVKELLISPAEGAPSQPPAGSEDQTAAAPPDPAAPQVASGPEPDAPAPTTGSSSGGREQAVSQQEIRRVRRLGAGRASFYQHPGRTAAGETYNPNKLTAAHRSLPFGTRVRVVNRENGRSVVVRINDRTPSEIPFVIDLSRGSARALGITADDGVAPVALYETK
jgi:rare lipoprotein A (peptidoglycan hydrolase)